MKIVFGVCGIGRGHIYEMFPVIEHYVRTEGITVAILAFGESFPYLRDRFAREDNVAVHEVFVPWVHADPDGLDYALTANNPFNHNPDFLRVNFSVMEKVKRELGKPTVVITNYEPVSAAYAYSTSSPLLTIDQQSKYLFDGYPDLLAGLSPWEERARLGMFFPRVDLRIINTFFRLPSEDALVYTGNVASFGPIIRDEISALKGATVNERDILIYLSPYSDFVQTPDELLGVLSMLPKFNFHIFTTKAAEFNARTEASAMKNIFVDDFNDENFIRVLRSCRAVISTAGHTFLSELMYLGKPVLAVPLGTYEQQYSAHVIKAGNFGDRVDSVTLQNVSDFLARLDEYERSIAVNSEEILYRVPAQEDIIAAIDSFVEKLP